jgi:vesicle coat complex subunit
MKHCEQVLFHMNWALLREQKEYCMNEAENKKDVAHIYDGVFRLLENLQDAAILDGIATEAEVFGSSPDEEGIEDD